MTVKEAARVLGASQDAVRKRVARGTLEAEKLPDGTVLVWVDAHQDDGAPTSRPDGVHPTQAHLDALESHIARLEAELEDRKEEARRKDHLLAAALERIPAIEPPETPQSPETPSEATRRVEPQDRPAEAQEGAEQRSWWRRFFGFE